jgi:hypothetical protein
MTSRKYKRYGCGSSKTQKRALIIGGKAKPVKPDERPSLFETIGTAAKNAIGNTVNFLEDKGARFVGFKRINQEEESKLLEAQQPSEISEKASELASTASNIASGVANKANQVGAIIVDELNKNMEGPVKETVETAIGNTVEVTKDILEEANEKLNNPQFVQDVAEAAKNASDTAAIMVEASSPAINQAIDKASEIGTKVASKVTESAANIALNTAEAIPGPGAVIGLARDVDKLATAGEAVLEAGAETAITFADTLKNAEEAIMKKMSETSAVTNRITDGVNNFNQVDNISKNLGVGSSTKNIMHTASAASALKKGGKPSRKFRRAKRRLSKKLHFKTAR